VKLLTISAESGTLTGPVHNNSRATRIIPTLGNLGRITIHYKVSKDSLNIYIYKDNSGTFKIEYNVKRVRSYYEIVMWRAMSPVSYATNFGYVPRGKEGTWS
jgi:hypothetical protein